MIPENVGTRTPSESNGWNKSKSKCASKQIINAIKKPYIEIDGWTTQGSPP